MDNGIYTDIDHVTYHAIVDRVSNSYLSRLAIVPAAAKVPQETTPAMNFGIALHSYVLDGQDTFEKNVCIEPVVNKRTNEGKEILAAFYEFHAGKTIITEDEYLSIVTMNEAVKAHPMASKLIDCGTNEVSVLWTDSFSGLDCKARPDIMPDASKRALIDLKKTRDASAHGFTRAVATYGYHRQAAFYLDGINKVTDGGYDVFAFIAVEDTAPYRVEVYTLSPAFIDRGRVEYQMLLNLENRCRAANAWPNYVEPKVTEIEMPKWMAYQEG